MSAKPVRQDWQAGAASDISPEVKAQLKRARKAQRPKATYDLPMSLINAVEDIAKRESVARSDVVAWALVEFVERYRASQVDWAKHKRPTKSLRVDWKLELPGDWR